MLIFYLIILQSISLGILLFMLHCYFRLNSYVKILSKTVLRYTMGSDKTDDIIDQLLAGESNNESACLDVSEATPNDKEFKRERLVVKAAGGQTELYLNKTYSIDQSDSFQESANTKLYSRYEAQLAAIMTKTIGKSALELAVISALNFLPISKRNHSLLVSDLEADPFKDYALNGIMCKVFHQYGELLAPITAAILTAKHFDFKQGYQARIPQQNGIGGGDDYSGSGDADASSDITSVTSVKDNNESNENKS